ncbi:hypothetical protein PBI_APPA_64 [Microbacterium phage Appa]|uniref:Uncharacterized protein n=1 Tax=Microbacterium phage Appa TaxID=2182350 RepID=A0A2U8UHW7_9CAUD|nr:hypothetical protein HOT26_gp50 [Microbacterium phage Appa]AWN03245.1 hypothetical protein PBI_APPA_64 [Microbacterium phage Appa]WNM67701.1 hypothetical protein SEA_DROPSHOT_64 [Microbacterium phage Dropshot]
MGVHESIGYRLVCDFPGCEFDTESMNDEYSSWTDRGYAIDEWREGDGYVGPEGVFCPTHTIWVEDEDGDRDSIAPMPYTIDSLFVLAERRIAERIENAARLARVRLDVRCREWEQRDRRIERHVQVALGNGGWHDLGSRSTVLVSASRRAVESVRS